MIKSHKKGGNCVSKKRLTILDCDGLLRQVTWAQIYDAHISICERFEINFDAICPNVAAFARWFDHDWTQNMRRMGIHDHDDMYEASVIFHETFDPTVTVYSWVPHILKQLHLKSHIGILSNSMTDSICNSLAHVRAHIDYFVGYDRMMRPKPHPDGIYDLMKISGTVASNTVMIGDTNVDVIAGKNAGVRTIVVSWGLTEKTNLLHKLQADLVVYDPSELAYIW